MFSFLLKELIFEFYLMLRSMYMYNQVTQVWNVSQGHCLIVVCVLKCYVKNKYYRRSDTLGYHSCRETDLNARTDIKIQQSHWGVKCRSRVIKCTWRVFYEKLLCICWERTDLLAYRFAVLLYDVLIVFLSAMVSGEGCGIWLYLFQIIAFSSTLTLTAII